MMGFGGGTPPNSNFNNNTSIQQQQQQTFGAPAAFGGTPTAFGSNAPQQQGFGSSGFGAASPPSNQPFGSTGFGASTSPPASTPTGFGHQGAPQAQAGLSFGASSNVAPFGQPQNYMGGTTNNSTGGGGGGGFGQSSFGASAPASGGFGGAPTTGSTFGSSPAPTGFIVQPTSSGQHFGGAPSSGMAAPFGGGSGGSTFGASATTTGFGSSPSAPTAPFGSSQTSTSFGGGQPFGAPVPSPASFRGNAGNSPAPSNMSNPFGAAAPASLVTFGMSSNVVASTGFGNANTFDSDMGSSSPTPWGFGSPMHQHSDNEDMDDHYQQQQQQQQQAASGLSFGTPANTSACPTPASSGFGSSLSPIPEMGQLRSNVGLSPTMADANVPSAASDDTIKASTEDDKLAMLKARIEEKKRRFEEQKRKKAEAVESSTTKRLSAATPAFVPSAPASGAPAFIGGPSAPASGAPAFIGGPSAARETPQSLADKNAMRFSSTKNSDAIRSHLPAELRAQAEGSQTNQASLRIDEREDPQALENAVSLLGTCQYMCPDEELLRRERESDIQLLEIPQPGRLHPEDWTLRNTVVKRFRRSAADYKLDVPEWVRPPDVLESVVAYLEEWVMERDRQGPDPRFPQGVVPPSLDVYQFIWDRTRMIRKDFILQNYIGTSGNCDARAVRCHERIARWHAMCEHQLSHLSHFVVAQSQQNMQELGQTMKTLNQYYDDSMGRALVEVPDKDGNETRAVPSDFVGCGSNVVQGTSPVDFDGSDLVNDTSSPALPLRIINKSAANTPNHGTAEPEMRGLYILLTMNNDGGMEVLKYAAQLFRERPEVYHSKPVQLALSIFKAKKEYNYARFFSILRSPSTPYLYACIMFKHVELIRKVALKIMYKTFGGKSKEKNEAIYDAYPLKDLIRLLCFEDADEALATCKHYNITVKTMKVKSSKGTNAEDIVFWKQTDFREPTDPEKGTIIPLRPRKMMKTIESKLNGATRLAVCRGEVSGEGAILTNIPSRPGVVQASPQAAANNAALVEQRAAALQALKQKLQDQKERDTRKANEAEDVRRRQEELKREEAERQQRNELKRQQDMEAAANREQEIRRQQEEVLKEEARLKQEEYERKERRLEIDREAARQKAEEEQRRKTELERQEATRVENERLMREQQERQRREEEIKRRKKKDARRLLKEEEERRARQAEEARRLELFRLKEEEERRQREAKKRRDAFEWQNKVDTARKRLLWLKWLQKFPRHLQMIEPTEESLRRLDPTFSSSVLVEVFANRVAPPSDSSLALRIVQEHRTDARRIIERLLHQPPDILDLASMIAGQAASADWMKEFVASQHRGKKPLLFKIAIVLPDSTDSRAQSLCALIHTWIDSRLRYSRISSDKSAGAELRVVVVDGNHAANLHTCDAVIFVVPPDAEASTARNWLKTIASRVGDDVARTVLVLGESLEPTSIKNRTRLLVEVFVGSFGTVSVAANADLSEEAMESALFSSCESLAKLLANREPLGLERISVGRLALKCISDVIWQDRLLEQRDDILVHAREALRFMVDEFETLLVDNQTNWQWPASDFATDAFMVPDYFGKGEGLPLDWTNAVSRGELGPSVALILNSLSGSLPSVIQHLLVGAPYSVKEEVVSLLDKRLFRRCLQRALAWSESNQPKEPNRFLYLPRGVLEDTIHITIQRLQEDLVGLLEPNLTRTGEASEALAPIQFSLRSPLRQTPVQQVQQDDGLFMQVMGKRPWSQSSESTGVDRLSTGLPRDASTPPKRRRHESPSQQAASRDRQESLAFSRKLDALLSGNAVQDMVIGSETLSSLLHGAPGLLGSPNRDYQ